MIQGHSCQIQNVLTSAGLHQVHTQALQAFKKQWATILNNSLDLGLLLQLFWCQSSTVHPAVSFSSVMQGCNFHFNFREEDVYWELLKLLQL